jgi:hypothetical protein
MKQLPEKKNLRADKTDIEFQANRLSILVIVSSRSESSLVRTRPRA